MSKPTPALNLGKSSSAAAAEEKERSDHEEDHDDGEESSLDVIVIDNGSGFTKAGFAGEDHPRAVVPSLLVKIDQQANGPSEGSASQSESMFVGHAAVRQLHQASIRDIGARPEISLPMDKGQIRDWNDMEKLWENIFKQELNVNSKEFPVLMTNTPLLKAEDRRTMADIMFNKLEVPSLCIVNSAVMSLFASGRTTGMVVEVGDGISAAVPVYQGYSVPHATLKLPVAGRELTLYLKQLLASRGVPFSDTHLDVVSDIKEKLCAVSTDRSTSELLARGGLMGSQVGSSLVLHEATHKQIKDDCTYELPDGRVLEMDSLTRLAIPEVLFQPQTWVDKKNEQPSSAAPGKDRAANTALRTTAQHRYHQQAAQYRTVGIHELCFDSLNICDPHLRKDLFQNIVLAGGSSMFKGFAERMKLELTGLSKGHENINVVADSRRKHSAWIGGSICASLSTFPHMRITREEYQADPDLIHKMWVG